MEFLTVIDSDGATHQVAAAQIVHVGPGLAAGVSEMTLTSGRVLQLATTPADFATGLVVAFPSITIAALP